MKSSPPTVVSISPKPSRLNKKTGCGPSLGVTHAINMVARKLAPSRLGLQLSIVNNLVAPCQRICWSTIQPGDEPIGSGTCSPNALAQTGRPGRSTAKGPKSLASRARLIGFCIAKPILVKLALRKIAANVTSPAKFVLDMIKCDGQN
jgi:hypothetical protein